MREGSVDGIICVMIVSMVSELGRFLVQIPWAPIALWLLLRTMDIQGSDHSPEPWVLWVLFRVWNTRGLVCLLLKTLGLMSLEY